MLHELNQGFAYCMSNTNRAFVSGPIIDGVFGGRGEGNFTAWMFACSAVTCVQYDPTVTCSTTCQAVA